MTTSFIATTKSNMAGRRWQATGRYLVLVFACLGCHCASLQAQSRSQTTCTPGTAITILISQTTCTGDIGQGSTEWEIGYPNPVTGAFVELGAVVGDNECGGSYSSCPDGDDAELADVYATIKAKSSKASSTTATYTFTVSSHPLSYITCDYPEGCTGTCDDPCSTGYTFYSITDTGISTFTENDCN